MKVFMLFILLTFFTLNFSDASNVKGCGVSYSTQEEARIALASYMFYVAESIPYDYSLDTCDELPKTEVQLAQHTLRRKCRVRPFQDSRWIKKSVCDPNNLIKVDCSEQERKLVRVKENFVNTEVEVSIFKIENGGCDNTKPYFVTYGGKPVEVKFASAEPIEDTGNTKKTHSGP